MKTGVSKIGDNKQWSQKSIVYYTGYTPEVWTPDSLKTGIGGSEHDLINLAKEWHKLGYKVTVYNNCGTKEGIYDGVNYLNYQRFNQFDTFDTLIMWRYPWRLSDQTKAQRIWLDLHEVLLPEQVTKKKLEIFDKIFVKSQYHRSLLPDISDYKISIITNGFNQDYFALSSREKDHKKIIYSSNYIRGLERMLTYGWPLIKKAIPEAYFHIYYGWQNFNDSKPENKRWKEKMLVLMKQPGVIEHGRVGQDQLIAEKSTSAIHYYGCTFKEIDCNSIRQSAAVGCVPVTSNYAVFKEKEYCFKVSGSPFEQKTQEEIANKIINLLNDPSALTEKRLTFQKLAQQESWENIAKLWLEQLS